MWRSRAILDTRLAHYGNFLCLKVRTFLLVYAAANNVETRRNL